MALMAAETLGVPYERIKAHVGDTEATGFCNVTGMAVIQACERPIPSLLAQPIRLPSLPLRSPAPRRGYYIAQCKQRAALNWDLDEDQVDWVDGEAIPKPGVNADVKPLSLADIATRLQAAPAPTAPANRCWAGPASIPKAQVRRSPATSRTPRRTRRPARSTS